MTTIQNAQVPETTTQYPASALTIIDPRRT